MSCEIYNTALLAKKYGNLPEPQPKLIMRVRGLIQPFLVKQGHLSGGSAKNHMKYIVNLKSDSPTVNNGIHII